MIDSDEDTARAIGFRDLGNAALLLIFAAVGGLELRSNGPTDNELTEGALSAQHRTNYGR
jgi:hypothetical protein